MVQEQGLVEPGGQVRCPVGELSEMRDVDVPAPAGVDDSIALRRAESIGVIAQGERIGVSHAHRRARQAGDPTSRSRLSLPGIQEPALYTVCRRQQRQDTEAQNRHACSFP